MLLTTAILRLEYLYKLSFHHLEKLYSCSKLKMRLPTLRIE